MGSKLAKVYYSPQSHLKGLAAIQELVEATKVPEKKQKAVAYQTNSLADLPPHAALYSLPKISYFDA